MSSSAGLVAALVALLHSGAPARVGAPVRLTTHDAEDRTPRCSPDSGRVAFASEREGTLDLFVLRFRDERIARLTRSAASDGSPAWSPDGGSLAFHRAGPGGSGAGIWVLSIDSGEERLLVADDSAEIAPEWSPDGTAIYFSSSRSGSVDLYRFGLEGGELDRLTGGPYRDVWPRVSPDGTELVFFSRRSTAGEFDELHRLSLALAPGEPVRVTTHPDHHDFTPAWSPDGRRLVVAESGRDGARELAILSRDGAVEERFASSYHRVFQPTWCGDGRIVFAARVGPDDRADLYQVSLPRD